MELETSDAAKEALMQRQQETIATLSRRLEEAGVLLRQVSSSVPKSPVASLTPAATKVVGEVAAIIASSSTPPSSAPPPSMSWPSSGPSALKVKELTNRMPAGFLSLSPQQRRGQFTSWLASFVDLADKYGFKLHTLRMRNLSEQQSLNFGALVWAAMENPMRASFEKCVVAADGNMGAAIVKFRFMCTGEAATVDVKERFNGLSRMKENEVIVTFAERYEQESEAIARDVGRAFTVEEATMLDRYFEARLSSKAKAAVRTLVAVKKPRAELIEHATILENVDSEQARIDAQATTKEKPGAAASSGRRIALAADGEHAAEEDYEEEEEEPGTAEQPAATLVADAPQDICEYCGHGNHGKHVCMKRIRDEKKAANEKAATAAPAAGQANTSNRGGASGRGNFAGGRGGGRGRRGGTGGRGGSRGGQQKNC